MSTDQNIPPQCLMDRNRLERIDTNVENLVAAFNDFRVEVTGRVTTLESQTRENKEDIKENKDTVSSLILKVGAIAGTISGGIWLAVLKMIGVDNG